MKASDAAATTPLSPAVSTKRLLLAIVLGALVGLATAFAVTSCLLAAYTSPFFAVYFGLVMLCVGGGLVVRAVAQKDNPKTRLLVGLGVLIMFSGFLSLGLRPNWLDSALVRVLYSTLIAVSASFITTFGLVDLATFVHDYVVAVRTDLVDSARQVNLILAGCIVLGVTCGAVWGALDVKSVSSLRLDWAVVLPVGALLGGVLSFTNESLRSRDAELRYSKLNQFGNEHDDGV